MKKTNFSEFRSKKLEELRILLASKKIDLLKVTSEMGAGKENNPSKKRLLKSEIAQISTIIREKELIDKYEKEQERNGGEKVK